MSLSIVIPCKNESQIIEETINHININLKDSYVVGDRWRDF